MNISATDLNQKSGQYLDACIKEPVTVEKMGRPYAVLVDHQYFQVLEDFYWGELAVKASKDAEYLSAEETKEFINSILAE